MFHIGKVRKVVMPKKKDVVSADAICTAIVRMWDNNLLILEVDRKIAPKLKENDYIIADYRPIAPNSPYRRMLITKILRGNTGQKIYKEFVSEYERKKSKKEQESEHAVEIAQAAQPYIR